MEKRVYGITASDAELFDLSIIADKQWIERAEEEGHVWSLQGFAVDYNVDDLPKGVCIRILDADSEQQHLTPDYSVQVSLFKLLSDLMIWYGSLPFERLNDIHAINLFDVSEEEIESVLDTLKFDWTEMTLDEQLDWYEYFN